jgi:hypothetical protein
MLATGKTKTLIVKPGEGRQLGISRSRRKSSITTDLREVDYGLNGTA